MSVAMEWSRQFFYRQTLPRLRKCFHTLCKFLLRLARRVGRVASVVETYAVTLPAKAGNTLSESISRVKCSETSHVDAALHCLQECCSQETFLRSRDVCWLTLAHLIPT